MEYTIDFNNLEEVFDDLREYETNSEEYNEIQGELFTGLQRDYRFNKLDATYMARYLSRGEVDDAEEIVEKVLEE